MTNEWRAQWPEEDQNCWQSKCHAPNHPPDGFEIPHYAPPVLGPDTLVRFDNALDLHDYIRQSMPWQEPASLSEKEYWDITVYLVRERGLVAPREPLDAEGARQIQLHPGRVSAVEPAEGPSSLGWILPVGAAVAVFLGVGLWLLWRWVRRRRA